MLSTFHSLKKWAEYEKVHYTLSDKDVHDVQKLLYLSWMIFMMYALIIISDM